MDRLRCNPLDLPADLWRVQYNTSNTTYNSTDGLVAADTRSRYAEDKNFGRSIVRHFTRSNRIPSPFISCFSDRGHAENWAGVMDKSSVCGAVQLLRIDTSALKHSVVFKLSTLIEKLGVTIPEGAAQHEAGAYVCLHRIPKQAIIDIQYMSVLPIKDDVASDEVLKLLATL